MMQADKPSWKALTHEQKLAVLTEHWTGGGMTAAELAAMYCDASRNAIIGSVHRAQLHRGKVVGATLRGERGERRQQARQAVARVKVAKAERKPAEPDPSGARLWDLIRNNRPPLDGIAPVSVLDIRPRNSKANQCRFPVLGGLCGADCGTAMYCETHHAIMYRQI